METKLNFFKILQAYEINIYDMKYILSSNVILTVKIIVVISCMAFTHASASSFRRSLTPYKKEVYKGRAPKSIEKQSANHFIHSDDVVFLKKALDIDIHNDGINKVPDLNFKNEPLSYWVTRRNINSKNKCVFDSVMLAASEDIRGTVFDEKGVPLAGVSVFLKGSTIGTTTDLKGHFSITVPNKNITLIFSYIGFVSQEINTHDQTVINVKLIERSGSLNELVVTGYQTERKADLTGAISAVNLRNIRDIPSGNPLQTLQGQVPGLYIEANGTPSGSTSKVLIRGLNTLGNTNPLYVIDGVPTKRPEVLQNLDPNSIQSIQVLKDASAGSIYGSRSSNGVIIITTKQGKGKTQIQFNSSLSVEKYSSKVNVLNTEERGRALWQASINDKTNPSVHSALYTYESHMDAQGKTVLDKINVVDWLGGGPSSGEHSANTDWQNEVFRTGVISANDITVSSGNENSNLFMNVGYFNNAGLVRYTDYKRYTGQLNSSTTLFDGKLKVGESFMLAKSVETPISTDLGGQSVLQVAKFEQPIIPVYTISGAYAGPVGGGFSDRNNPLHMLYINKNNKNNLLNTFGNLFAELKPFKNFVFRSTFGFDYASSYNIIIQEAFTEGNLSRTTNSLSNTQGHQLNLTFSNTLNYQYELGRHRFNFLLGTEAVKEQFVGFTASKEGFANQDVSYFYLDAGTGRSTTGGSATGDQLLSYFGKINYSFNDKYLASATLRRDGSSRFGSNNKFGYFPALTLGWRVSGEEFFKKNIVFITDLKLRGGIGSVGNQDIGDNATFGLYRANYGTVTNGYHNTGTAYDLSGVGTGALLSGYVSVQAANPDLKWESTAEMNLGLDFGIFGDKLNGSFDYFSRKTKDILIQLPTSGIQGEGRTKIVNGASTVNKGWEGALNYHNTSGQISYNVNANIGAFHDKITYLPASVISSYPGNPGNTILGHSQSDVFGYLVDGIFQNDQEVNNSAAQPGKGVGRLRYKDLNNDGKVDPLDRNWLGNQLPDFSYGFGGNISYMNFSLSFFFQGVQGINVYNSIKYQTDFVGTAAGVNYGRRVLDAWTPKNNKSIIPAVSLLDANSETRISNYYLENGSYLKLRNLQLGYKFLKSLSQRWKMNELRVYVLGENLSTINGKRAANHFTGPDPENSGNLYPRPTKFTFGISATF